MRALILLALLPGCMSTATHERLIFNRTVDTYRDSLEITKWAHSREDAICKIRQAQIDFIVDGLRP